MLEMIVDSVRVCPSNKYPALFLKCQDYDLFLPIFVSSPEADAIAARLGGSSPYRPLTHDLIITIVHELGGEVTSVAINDVRDCIAYANVSLYARGAEYLLDSRPGDAVALALRVRVPIYAEESVLDDAAWALDQVTGALVMPSHDQFLSSDRSRAIDQEGFERMSAFAELIATLELDDFE